MPGDRCTNARLFNKQRLVKGSEVLAIDGFCDFQELGVAVDPETGLRELQGAEEDKGRPFRCILGGLGFMEFDLMPAVGEISSSKRITQRLRPQ